MSGDPSSIIERLRVIEEDFRDLAYDRIRGSLETNSVLAEERKIHQARRAVEKAIHLLEAAGGQVPPED